MDLGITERLEPLLHSVTTFIEQEIMPVEAEYWQEVATGDRWQFTDRQTEIMKP